METSDPRIIQQQVRQNADEMHNAINSLYSWQNVIKEKEMKLKEAVASEPNPPINVPVRVANSKQTSEPLVQKPTAIIDNTNIKSNGITETKTETAATSAEIVEDAHMQANKIKDKGNEFVKLEQYEQAIREYTAAIKIYERDAIYFANRALCYIRLERYQESIEDCNSALKIDAKSVKALYRRMQAHESLGNNNEACKDCEAVLKMDPTNTAAINSLVRIKERLKKSVSTGPNFTKPTENMVLIQSVKKPPHKRSTKPLVSVVIEEVINATNKNGKEMQPVKISDEDIDKLFNSNCGPYVEVKKKPASVVEELKKFEKIPENDIGSKKEEKRQSVKVLPIPTNSDGLMKMLTLPPAPNSSNQFYTNWKQLTDEQKYLYLKSININILPKILGAGFDADTLREVIGVIHDYYLSKNDKNTTATMLAISQNSEIPIISMFMSSDDRKMLTNILNTIREEHTHDKEIDEIVKNFKIE